MVLFSHQLFAPPPVCRIHLTTEPLRRASQPCCHLFSCTCSGCSVASFILIILLWVTAYTV